MAGRKVGPETLWTLADTTGTVGTVEGEEVELGLAGSAAVRAVAGEAGGRAEAAGATGRMGEVPTRTGCGALVVDEVGLGRGRGSYWAGSAVSS